MRQKIWNMFFLVIPFLIFGGESILKKKIEEDASLSNGKIGKKLLGNKILVRRYHNYGAILDLGEHKSRWVAALSVLLTVLLSGIFFLTLTGYGSNALRAGLALLLGGAFSNTYDRLKRKYVVDYFSINVKWEPLRRIVFNLSDFCILIGALIAALRME